MTGRRWPALLPLLLLVNSAIALPLISFGSVGTYNFVGMLLSMAVYACDGLVNYWVIFAVIRSNKTAAIAGSLVPVLFSSVAYSALAQRWVILVSPSVSAVFGATLAYAFMERRVTTGR